MHLLKTHCTTKLKEFSRHLAMLSVIAIAIAVTGCSIHPLEEPPTRTEAFIHLKIVDELPQGKDLAGYTECSSTGICRVWIRADHYPLCIEHEIGHVTHGSWHGDEPTECGYANPPLF